MITEPQVPDRGPTQAVIRGARFILAHVPGLVGAGSKPRREVAAGGAALRAELRNRLRSYESAVAYPPHQVMIGTLTPEALREIPRPWHGRPIAGARPQGPAGAIIDQMSFYAWLARADAANLVRFTDDFAARLADVTHTGPVAAAGAREIARTLEDRGEPLFHDDDHPVGAVAPGHEQDEALSAAVLLENLAAKVTGALALRQLLDGAPDRDPVEYLVGCGEEAVGDRYQRGGGNLAKAMGELAGVRTAGGADVKAFCAAPLHGLLMAGALVASGRYRRVVVVAGGSLAKLGMKFRGHLAAGYPVLEDVLAGVAIDVARDDGRSPIVRLDTAAVHRVGDGTAPHQMARVLTLEPLRALGLRLSDIDRYAVELHNPDITEPAGSGNVPAANYQMIAALAAQAGEITRSDIPAFSEAHGMPGYSPTQGHIASAIPYLPHAVTGLMDGTLRRVQLVAKGSLFLGRMTGMGDGISMLLVRNDGHTGQRGGPDGGVHGEARPGPR
jgi:glycine/sarcosine/betaine reductase complex component C subunit beta